MNNDLISRSELKKAIAEFHQKQKDRLHNHLWDSISVNNLNDLIGNAPTVEPFEPDYVGAERLKARQRGYEEGYHNGMEIGKTLNPKIKQGEWIPVSERLPQNRDWYLGVFKEPDTGFIGIPYICDYVGKVTKGTTNEGWILRHCTDVDNDSDYFRNLICVAWQPLPEPYEKGGAE